jgi:hypothetical protein
MVGDSLVHKSEPTDERRLCGTDARPVADGQLKAPHTVFLTDPHGWVSCELPRLVGRFLGLFVDGFGQVQADGLARGQLPGGQVGEGVPDAACAGEGTVGPFQIGHSEAEGDLAFCVP